VRRQDPVNQPSTDLVFPIHFHGQVEVGGFQASQLGTNQTSGWVDKTRTPSIKYYRIQPTRCPSPADVEGGSEFDSEKMMLLYGLRSGTYRVSESTDRGKVDRRRDSEVFLR
jgi:hypothetical protein